MLKTTVCQLMAISWVGMPSMAILPPWHMLASMSRKAVGLPDISRPTSKPSFMPSSSWASGDRSLADVDGERGAQLAGQLQAERVDVGHDDVPGPGVPDDRGGHDADRSGAGDQHVLAQHVELTAPCARRCRTGRRSPARRGGSAGSCTQTLVIGSARYSANAPGRLTPTPLVSLQRCRRPARQLRHRPQTTCPSPLTISPTWKSLTFEPTSTIVADELVTDHHGHGDRLLGPGVPLVDMHVRSADAGPQDLDQDVVDADPGDRDPLEPQSGLGLFLHQGLHRFHRLRSPGSGSISATRRASSAHHP